MMTDLNYFLVALAPLNNLSDCSEYDLSGVVSLLTLDSRQPT